jgi:hypothetical protein
MRKKISIMAAVSALALTTVQAGQDQPQTYKHDFTVGLESLHYHYDETTPEHKNFMNDKGMLYGLNGAYQFTYKNAFFVRPEARIVYGHVDYESWRGEETKSRHIPSMIAEVRLLSGWNFKPITSLQKLTLSPYTGIGYRYKWDDSSDIKGKDNIAGYKRVNKLWYVPLGVRFNHDFENRWFMQGLAEYDWMIQGRHLTYDKHRAPSPTVYRQKSGWGLKGELLAGYHFDKASVSFGPYINYWKIKKSSTERITYHADDGVVFRDAPFWEPANMARELGVKLNFIF